MKGRDDRKGVGGTDGIMGWKKGMKEWVEGKGLKKEMEDSDGR